MFYLVIDISKKEPPFLVSGVQYLTWRCLVIETLCVHHFVVMFGYNDNNVTMMWLNLSYVARKSITYSIYVSMLYRGGSYKCRIHPIWKGWYMNIIHVIPRVQIVLKIKCIWLGKISSWVFEKKGGEEREMKGGGKWMENYKWAWLGSWWRCMIFQKGFARQMPCQG